MPEYALSQLLALAGVPAQGLPSLPIRGVAALDQAGPDQLAFAESERLRSEVEASAAAAVLVPPGFPALERPLLVTTPEPRLTFIRAAERFLPPRGSSGVHPLACLDPSVQLGAGVSVGAYAVVEAGTCIGVGSWIGPGVYVGAGVQIGADCRIEAHSCLFEGVRLGDRVIINGGARIGHDGFGYLWVDDHHHRVPQLGSVWIEDDVEIGCNSCVDRATLGVTRIGRGVKIDNLVQVGHNCDIGAHAILVSQVGISGSVTIGAGAILAGQVGVADHLSIGAGARVGGATKVTSSVGPGEAVLGMPPRPNRNFWREQAEIGRAHV
jgi:UDP-3-O-[3-hydroxymyristoyl] glucosamine N-acyltransferase